MPGVLIVEAMAQAAAEKMGIPASEVFFSRGYVCPRGEEGRALPIDEVIRVAEAKFGTLGATGWYKTPPKLGGEYRGGTIGASPAYSTTAHVVEASVDVETGIIRVERVWAAHDCGRALNPTIVEGQIEGSVYMGWAEAMME